VAKIWLNFFVKIFALFLRLEFQESVLNARKLLFRISRHSVDSFAAFQSLLKSNFPPAQKLVRKPFDFLQASDLKKGFHPSGVVLFPF
jgi:hypothetical protein